MIIPYTENFPAEKRTSIHGAIIDNKYRKKFQELREMGIILAHEETPESDQIYFISHSSCNLLCLVEHNKSYDHHHWEILLDELGSVDGAIRSLTVYEEKAT